MASTGYSSNSGPKRRTSRCTFDSPYGLFANTCIQGHAISRVGNVNFFPSSSLPSDRNLDVLFFDVDLKMHQLARGYLFSYEQNLGNLSATSYLLVARLMFSYDSANLVFISSYSLYALHAHSTQVISYFIVLKKICHIYPIES